MTRQLYVYCIAVSNIDALIGRVKPRPQASKYKNIVQKRRTQINMKDNMYSISDNIY